MQCEGIARGQTVQGWYTPPLFPMRPSLIVPLVFALVACGGRYRPAARCLTVTPSPARANALSVDLEDSETVPVAGAPRMGDANAPVTVVVFSDFQCPYCNRGRSIASDLRAMFPDEVRVVWRNLPLPRHPHARPAAEAAMEVFAQRGDSGFWRFHDLLFAHQDALAPEDLERYAARVGVEMSRFRRAMSDHDHAAAIDGDIALAGRLGVDGTPSFVMNGTVIPGAQPLVVFEQLTLAVLDRARGISDPRRVYSAMVEAPLPAPERPRPAPRRTEDFARVHTVPIPPGAPALGPEDAAVTVQVFSDFQCGFCARVEPTLAALRAHYGPRLRVVWRDYPLSFHAFATQAAEAAREAMAQRGPQGFWTYHDLLFAHQEDDGGLSRPALERYAREMGMDLPRFRVALDDHRHLPAVQADQAAGTATGLRFGTPSFFINGHFLSGQRPLEEFRARIDGLLTT